jgi:ferritin-like metal-binding protein YciE
VLDRVQIHNPQELFAYNLGGALKMENTIDGMLGKLVDEAQGSALKAMLRDHREETQAQIRNLQQAFRALGKEPDEQPCPAIEGIEKEGESNLKLVDEQLKDTVILAGCAETEHHEIAVYENLIAHADAMGQEDVVALLRENLEQEQQTLGKVLRATLDEAKQRPAAVR